jgi:hypothetical protein
LHGIAQVKSFDGFGDVAHEVGAAQFAVGEDFESNVFLALQNAEDLLVFQCMQFIRGNVRAARSEQVCGTEKTAHMVGAK